MSKSKFTTNSEFKKLFDSYKISSSKMATVIGISRQRIDYYLTETREMYLSDLEKTRESLKQAEANGTIQKANQRRNSKKCNISD